MRSLALTGHRDPAGLAVGNDWSGVSKSVKCIGFPFGGRCLGAAYIKRSAGGDLKSTKYGNGYGNYSKRDTDLAPTDAKCVDYKSITRSKTLTAFQKLISVLACIFRMNNEYFQ